MSLGNRDDKVKAAFDLYDFNGDGFISLDEMTRYLTSVFRVLHETNPTRLKSMDISSPEELGAVTAEKAFIQADLNMDGQLSFDEFSDWYKQSYDTVMGQVVQDSVPDWWSREEIQRLCGLENMSSAQVFEDLAEAADEDGFLNRNSFQAFFKNFVFQQNTNRALDLDRLQIIIDKLFSVFDTDENGFLDFSEISIGLSVLCGDSRDDKVKAAFDLYDFNGDGYITQDAMQSYLTSIYKILYATKESTTGHAISAEELGQRTAQQAFEEADMDRDGKLTFDEFRHWYTTPPSSLSEPSTLFTLEGIRNFTKLFRYSADHVFKVFCQHCNEMGILSRTAFDACFQSLNDNDNDEDTMFIDIRMQNIVLDRLFDIFDTDHNGEVDVIELSSGLSLVCGGNRESKIAAVFSVVDSNGDGFISKNGK